MRPPLPPLNALRAFEAAGRLGSFKDAAAELHVTHGAISQQVRLLEAWLGAPLFERHNRRVVLTSAARAWLAQIGPLFDQLAQATARFGLPEAVPRTLAVNAPATFTLRWLVPRLEKFRARHADIEVRIETSNEPVESLKDTCDIVIRGGPDTFYGYAMRPFLAEERLPVCSPRCSNACRSARRRICAGTRSCIRRACRASGRTGSRRRTCPRSRLRRR